LGVNEKEVNAVGAATDCRSPPIAVNEGDVRAMQIEIEVDPIYDGYGLVERGGGATATRRRPSGMVARKADGGHCPHWFHHRIHPVRAPRHVDIVGAGRFQGPAARTRRDLGSRASNAARSS
jgi:hypothetical protein